MKSFVGIVERIGSSLAPANPIHVSHTSVWTSTFVNAVKFTCKLLTVKRFSLNNIPAEDMKILHHLRHWWKHGKSRTSNLKVRNHISLPRRYKPIHLLEVRGIISIKSFRIHRDLLTTTK
jgi:hypothetical protein